MRPQPAVLIIDDDEDLRQIALDTLQQVDPDGRFEHLQASDGASGIAAIRRLVDAGRPLLVLCDYRMPLMDGMRVAEKTLPARGQVPMHFVLLSSYGSPTALDASPDRGVDQVLEKGFHPQEWRDQFERVLEAFLADLDRNGGD